METALFFGQIIVTGCCYFACFLQQDGTGGPSALRAVLAGIMVNHCNPSATFYHLLSFLPNFDVNWSRCSDMSRSHCFEGETAIDIS